ncbi:hypothetical protein [Prevotella sp.]|uniref:hypothetical protein n=1 Tax=Prevotella sp. TaxID=59823 RepID=UPI00307FF9F3
MMNIRKYSVLVALMMIVTCGQSAASRFAGNEKTDDNSLPSDILSYGKGARGKEFYGLRMGGNGGTLVPVFSKDSSYVAIITCDTTKKGKTGDVGLLSVYSAKDRRKAAWVKKINPKTTSFSINGPYMVSVMQVEVGKEKAIRNYVEFRKLETGMVESFIQTTPIYVNDSLDIVLGVGNDAFPDLFAYRISDGSFLWKSDKWGSQAQRCYTQLYDEKTLFAVADNLYKINLETGKVYKKKVRAYDEGLDASAFFVGGLIGSFLSTVLLGPPHYYYCLYCPMRKPLGYLGSNICFENGNVYMADCSNVYCFDMMLNEMWRTKLDAKGGNIVLKADSLKLSVFSNGYGTDDDDKKVNLGKTFYMELYSRSGRGIMGQTFSKGINAVRDTLANGETLKTLLFKNSIVWLSEDMRDVRTVEYPKKTYGKFRNFIKGQAYLGVEKRSRFECLDKGKGCIVVNDKDSAFVIKDDGNVVRSYDASNVYTKCLELDNLSFMKNNSGRTRFFITDKDIELKVELDDDVIDVYRFADGVIVARKGSFVFIDGDKLKEFGK